jgi:hypothetical protein
MSITYPFFLELVYLCRELVNMKGAPDYDLSKMILLVLGF